MAGGGGGGVRVEEFRHASDLSWPPSRPAADLHTESRVIGLEGVRL